MKRLIIAGAVLSLAACQPGDEAQQQGNAGGNGVIPTANATASSQFDNEDSRASYAIGLRYGEAVRRDLSELDLEAFSLGMQHGFRGEEPVMSQEETMASLQALQERKMAEMEKQAQEQSSVNKKAGDEYQTENAARGEVKVTESGLQYEVLRAGDGAMPSEEDSVTVHYHGTLVNGDVFDSSVQRGEPATFPVGGVIPGWVEALQMMKTGAKWRIVIPPELAYGERGAGDKIGPNSTLTFEVELLKINE